MVITIDELQTLFEKIIEKLERESLDSINIEEVDYYWNIPTSEWTELDANVQPAVGSLMDDWQYLQKVISNENILTTVDFERVSSILKALSELL